MPDFEVLRCTKEEIINKITYSIMKGDETGSNWLHINNKKDKNNIKSIIIPLEDLEKFLDNGRLE